MTSAFARAVKKAVDSGRFTVTELCAPELANCSERHFYNFLNGDAELKHGVVEAISRYLSKHDFNAAADSFHDLKYVLVRRILGRANGSVKDEMIRMIKRVAGVDDAFDSQSREEMRHALDDIRQALADLEAEYELLPY